MIKCNVSYNSGFLQMFVFVGERGKKTSIEVHSIAEISLHDSIITMVLQNDTAAVACALGKIEKHNSDDILVIWSIV